MKNLKLLLATTAILSISTMAAKADATNPVAELKAYVDLANPVTVVTEPVNFGVLDISQGGFIKVHGGTTDETSTAIHISGGANGGSISFSGGAIVKMIESGDWVLFDTPEPITLKSGNVECGTWTINEFGDQISKGIAPNYTSVEFHPTSTFEIKSNLSSEAYLHCSGKAEITYFLDYSPTED